MHKKIAGLVVSCLLILLAALPAQAGRIGVGAYAGTTGAGAEMTVHLIPFLNLRAGVQGFNYSTSMSPEDVRYDFDMKFVSESLLLDYHPLGGGLRISAGIFYNQDSIDLTAQPTANYRLGGLTVTPEQVGQLVGEIKYKPSSPYVGLGWGNAGDNDLLSDLGFQLDLGVLFKGSPDVELTSTGTLRNDPDFQLALERERREIEDKLDSYKYYPVIRLGLTYNF